ncbi:MAG: Txe/YoeB family addiction module toxin [Saprospiraceae bacterium]
MKSIKFTSKAFRDFLEWQSEDEDVFEKIGDLIVEVTRDPFKGRGKPEPLKGDFSGCWSRRITQEHRLVYRVEADMITVLKCKGHYDD